MDLALPSQPAKPHHVGHPDTGPQEPLLKAALTYARDGILVFPIYWRGDDGCCTCDKGQRCPDAGKHPVYDKRLGLVRGHKAATTDEDIIREWWNAYPQANIGGRTGPESGFFVVDEDPRHGGIATREALQAAYGPLFETMATRTGGGGTHYAFCYPEGETIKCDNTGKKLGQGLDVKGQGGYVLLPPSRTRSTYEPLNDLPVAEAPAWLIRRLRGSSGPDAAKGRMSAKNADPVSADVNRPPIIRGERNSALTSIAGRLHDGSRTRAELEATLLEINAKCCDPPLEEIEVKKLARSVYGLAPCKASVCVSREVEQALDIIEEDMWTRSERWRGKAGLSRWKIKYALVDAAREYGRIVPGGVRVSLSRRDLAERAGTALSTVQSNIYPMRKTGELRFDNMGRLPDEAGAFVLPLPECANPVHSPTTTGLLRSTMITSVPDLRVLKKLRHSAPDVWRLGPRAGMAALALLRSGGMLCCEELASKLGIRRVRDLHRKGGVLERMVRIGMVDECEGTVSLSPRWHDALRRARGVGREEQAEQYQRLSYQIERDRYGQYLAAQTHYRDSASSSIS